MADCITINGLEMRFRGCEALRGIDLQIPTGSIYALLGENGAGKTTLIRILTGFQMPTHGSCRVLNFDPTREAYQLRKKIGYVSDSPALYEWMRIDEIGWFASSFYDDDYLERYRQAVAKFELPADRKIKHLSKGQRAKVALALATSHDPELLIMDEPTSGLDPIVRREFLESMVDRVAAGKTVLLSSHQIADVERVADHVAVIHQGKIGLSGGLQELRESIFEVTLTLKDSLAAVPVVESPAVVIHEVHEGREVKWVVKNYSPEVAKAISQLPTVDGVRSRSVNLEDLFVACTRSNRSVGV